MRSRPSFWLVALVLFTVAVVVGCRRRRALVRPPPGPVVRVTASAIAVVPGSAPALPWPAAGQSAVAVPALGSEPESGPETPVPIASLTKIMTAYVILRDHPLAPGAERAVGHLDRQPTRPTSTRTRSTDEANVEVQAGEVLTERQLLDGLLVHSANNLADTLARWDAGTSRPSWPR